MPRKPKSDTFLVHERACSLCGNKKPLTADHWHADAHRDDGFRSECKDCRARADQVEQATAVIAKAAKLEGTILNRLGELSPTALTSIPHIAQVAEQLMDVFGGIDGFTQNVAMNYMASPLGSATRQRTEASILQIVAGVSAAGHADIQLDQMTNDDIDRELERGLRLLTETGEYADPTPIESAERSA